jgi:hypothetical protein
MIREFFLFCSGANRSVLAECPSEKTKYAGIGATVFFTALLAGLSGGYALYTVFLSPELAIPFGVLWALMIFNLDRVIVSGMRKQREFRLDLLYATPRLLLATLLAIVISKPIELKLFEREIEAQRIHSYNVAYQRTVQTVDQGFGELRQLEQQNASLDSEIGTKQKELGKATQEKNQEIDGTGGTGTSGDGPVAHQKGLYVDEVKRQLDDLEKRNGALIARNLETISALKKDRERRIQEAAAAKKRADGFLARIEAFSQLSSESRAMSLASFFITLLFIALETAPVAVKLLSTLSPYRPYDQKLEDLESEIVEQSAQHMRLLRHRLSAEAQSAISDYDAGLNAQIAISTEKNRQIRDTELQANKALIQRIADAQAEIAGEIVDRWKARELAKVETDPVATGYINVA